MLTIAHRVNTITDSDNKDVTMYEGFQTWLSGSDFALIDEAPPNHTSVCPL